MVNSDGRVIRAILASACLLLTVPVATSAQSTTLSLLTIKKSAHQSVRGLEAVKAASKANVSTEGLMSVAIEDDEFAATVPLPSSFYFFGSNFGSAAANESILYWHPRMNLLFERKDLQMFVGGIGLGLSAKQTTSLHVSDKAEQRGSYQVTRMVAVGKSAETPDSTIKMEIRLFRSSKAQLIEVQTLPDTSSSTPSFSLGSVWKVLRTVKDDGTVGQEMVGEAPATFYEQGLKAGESLVYRSDAEGRNWEVLPYVLAETLPSSSSGGAMLYAGRLASTVVPMALLFINLFSS